MVLLSVETSALIGAKSVEDGGIEVTELYLPSLPEFEVKKDIEFSFEDKSVMFELCLGVLEVTCFVKAIDVLDTLEAWSDSDPQNSIDCDFKWLEVENTPVEVHRTDIDLVDGQRLKLTEKQRNQLNEYLKDEMVMV